MTMRMTVRLRGLGALLLLLAPLAPRAASQEPAASDPHDHVSYVSRESGGEGALRLVVEHVDGTSESLPAVADAMIIGYLPERRFGGLAFLAVDMCASNRALLRFGPCAGRSARPRSS